MGDRVAFIDYYEVLGVAHNASEDDIEKAYRALIRKHHPDLGGDTATAQLINEAHDALSKPGRRTRYDAEYRYRRSRVGTTSPGAGGYAGTQTQRGYGAADFPGYTTTTSTEDWQPFDWRSDPDISGGTRLLITLFENLPTILGMIVMLIRATWTAARIGVPVAVVGLIATAVAMSANGGAGAWVFVSAMLVVLGLVAWTYILALSNPVGFDRWSAFFWGGLAGRGRRSA
jgi:hypothetical protein